MSKALQEKLRHVLANTVGSIVELPESALSVAVLSGKASLGPGLKIKKDVFEQLGMPVVLTAGSIESIEIDIPTTSLRTKPVVIRIRDVLIGLSPNPDANTRRAKLAAQERLWQQAGEEGEGIDPESAMGKMVQKIVDNIHIIVEDVHIRLEDTRTQSERYAMGLVLDRFSLRSYVVDRTGWAETCAKQVQRFLNKCLVFGDDTALPGQSGLGIYLHPGEAPVANPGSEAWRAAMLSYIVRQKRERDGARPVSWVVGPSVIRTRISIDKQDSFDGCFSRCWSGQGAKQEVQVFISRLPVKLRNTALRNLYGLLFFYQNASRWQRFVQSRPACPVLGNAREWWQFAIKCELGEINRKTISVQALCKVTREGREYVAMYSRKAGAGRPWLTPLDAGESARLREFEDRYPADVTKTFRIQAWRLLLDGDKERQQQIQEERDRGNALIAAPSARWGRTDLHSNFVVEHAGMISHEMAGNSARKKGKESFAVVVSLKEGGIPAVREGWLQRRMQQDGAKWQKRYFVLTADEFYHSAKATGAKKSRIPLSTCQIPEKRARGFEFELKSKDAVLVLRCEDDASRQGWVKDIAETITKRSTVETIMFDPTNHLSKEANLDNISFTLHVKMEAATPAKSSFRKKKTAMDDVLLHMTPGAFMICSFQPISSEAAEELNGMQSVHLDRGEGLATHRVNTRFTFKRLRTWSLEQNSTCCKIEVTQAAGSLTALRFFSSSESTADEVMEAIQQCIAAVIANQKQAKERRAQIKTTIADMLGQHEPQRLAELDELMHRHPGQKAEELLQQLCSQYAADSSASPDLSAAAAASAATDTASSDVRITFEKEGRLGISFGSKSDDTIGWIDAVRPDGLASEFPQLKNGMFLVAVQDQPVSSYQQAVEAIGAVGRPLHLTFRDRVDQSRGSEQSPAGSAQELLAASDTPPESASTSNASVENPTDVKTSESPGDEKVAETTQSRWLLRYASDNEDVAVEAIHLATYETTVPVRPRKEYAYEAALTVKHLDGAVHKFTVATADKTSGVSLAQVFESGASKEIDLASTPTVTPAQEDLLDTMDVLQNFSFTSSYTDPHEDDDDDTPRAAIRESMREPGKLSPARESGSETLEPTGASPTKAMHDAVIRASVHVELVDVDLSMATFDICKLKATSVLGSAMRNMHGAKLLTLAVGDATLVDLYSRDSVFETLVAAVQPVDSCWKTREDEDWQPVLSRPDKLGGAPNSFDSSKIGRAPSSFDSKGRRMSTEDAAVEDASPSAGGFEDAYWSMTRPTPNLLLWCEYEQAADSSVQLGDSLYAACTVLKLRPVRLVANFALLPVLQDFLKLQDFKVMQAATNKALGRIDKLRKKREAAIIAKANRIFDVSISGEVIVPESLAIAEEDALVLVCSAAELSLKTGTTGADDMATSNSENGTQIASIAALQSFTCTRTTWLQAVAAQAQQAKAVPLWVWMEPAGKAEASTPLPFSASMCAKLEAAFAAGADNCKNEDRTAGVSVVQLRPASKSDRSCVVPELGQAAMTYTEASGKTELRYKVYRDITAGKDSRPPIVEQFFDDFRVHKEPPEMSMFRANGILLPFSANARVKRTEERSSSGATEAAGFDIACEADKLQLQLSGKTMRELLVIALHAVEAASTHNASLARVIKAMLYEKRAWPWKRRRSAKVETTSSSSTKSFASRFFKKLFPSSDLAKLHATGLAQTVRAGIVANTEVSSADQPGAAPTATIPDGRALLLSINLKFNLVDVTLKGEPRGSDSSIDALTLGLRAYGVDTGIVLTDATATKHLAIEGVEVMHSQSDTVRAEDGHNFAAWPHAGVVSVARPEMNVVTQVYTTGEEAKRVEFHGARDLLSILDAKELARLLPIASTVVNESERVIAMVKPLAARVGLATKIPGVPAKWTKVLRDLTGATATATDDMEGLMADQAAAVAEMRASLRALVDQQVAKYSALVDQQVAKYSAGNLGTAADLAASALRGDTSDAIEKAKADLRTQLGSVVSGKIAALATEMEQDTKEDSSESDGNQMKAKISKAVLGGAQQLVDLAMSPDGLDAVEMRQLVREQAAGLEAEIREEVEQQLSQRLVSLELDPPAGDSALKPELLQTENARLTAQLEALARDNERLVAELAALQAEK